MEYSLQNLSMEIAASTPKLFSTGSSSSSDRRLRRVAVTLLIEMLLLVRWYPQILKAAEFAATAAAANISLPLPGFPLATARQTG
uniref:Uncharacterized protein n=1 Tax=Salix viminalis TaxID=40686 RepID=A0A6N2KC78_SALVM